MRNLLIRNEDGATLMEFGLIAGPFTFMLLGIMDLGYQGYVGTLAKAKLHEVARDASTGEMTLTEIKTAVRDGLEPILLKDAKVKVRVKSYFAFTNIGKPEKLTTDLNNNGELDDGDCYIDTNENDAFDTDYGQNGTGGPDDIVNYRIIVESPRIFPLPQLFGSDDEISITTETAVRNQPFGAQVELIETCESDLD